MSLYQKSPWLWFAVAMLTSLPLTAEVLEETLTHPGFGKLALYRPADPPKGLLLFIAGDSGWNKDLAETARAIADLDYLVAGIDGAAYLHRLNAADSGCGDLAADLMDLRRFLESRYALSAEKPPVLAGHASAAALVYAALAQAPPQAFHAGISLDFCPQLPLHKSLCQGRTLESLPLPEDKGIALLPSQHLETGWFIFQAAPSCTQETVAQFTNRTDSDRLVVLAKGGHQGSEPGPWLAQLTALLQWLDPGIPDQVRLDSDVSGVPLKEVPAAAGGHDSRLAVILTGDGGWAALDRAVAAELARQGIATVGWDSLSYFWQPKTPEQAARDLERVLQHYLKAWNKEHVILIGYSFGADVLPFMVSRLSPVMRSRIGLVALLGLSKKASFEFHLTEWLGRSPAKGALPVVPEVEKLKEMKRLCLYGDQETDSACPGVAKAGVTVVKVPGDHHFNEDYPGVAKRILDVATP